MRLPLWEVGAYFSFSRVFSLRRSSVFYVHRRGLRVRYFLILFVYFRLLTMYRRIDAIASLIGTYRVFYVHRRGLRNRRYRVSYSPFLQVMSLLVGAIRF